MFKYILSLLLSLIVMNIYAQDVSGKWIGNYSQNFLGGGTQKLEVEIEIYNDSLIRGTSYLTYGGNRHEKYEINGVFHQYDSTLIFSEDEEISVNLGLLASNVMGTYSMKLKVYDTLLRMDGKWKQKGSDFFGMMNSKVWLEKPIPKENMAQKTEPEIKNDVKEETIIDNNLTRKSDIQKIIEISEEERNNIRLEIIDNARLDKDIISVYVNGEQQLYKQTISDIAQSLQFSIPNNEKEATITIAAESYGAMPPCTALLTIFTSNNKYVVDLSSSFDSNAIVKLLVKK